MFYSVFTKTDGFASSNKGKLDRIGLEVTTLERGLG
jgi:hypothetical protein